MKIGDLIYNGEKISDIASRCIYMDGLECMNCEYKLDDSGICELLDYASIEIELPPIIKASDVAKDAINPAHKYRK